MNQRRITLLGSLKNVDALAVSGGPDSMGALEFMLNGKHQLFVLHFDHKTNHAKKALEFVQDYCNDYQLDLKIGSIQGSKPKKESWEEWWRNERYRFLNSLPWTVATAHTLDDSGETWLMGAIHGRTKLIPYQTRNVVRPFLLTPKENLRKWAKDYVLDPSNDDMKYDRVKIRAMMSYVQGVNPGYLTVVSKKIRAAIPARSI